VDIVAIHGLGGDAYRTWTHPKSKKLWLRDFLPQDFPGARTFSFGYSAEVFFSRSTGTIDQYARSLLEGLVRERADEVGLFLSPSWTGISKDSCADDA
jgi:hypothetical protein